MAFSSKGAIYFTKFAYLLLFSKPASFIFTTAELDLYLFPCCYFISYFFTLFIKAIKWFVVSGAAQVLEVTSVWFLSNIIVVFIPFSFPPLANYIWNTSWLTDGDAFTLFFSFLLIKTLQRGEEGRTVTAVDEGKDTISTPASGWHEGEGGQPITCLEAKNKKQI